MNRIQELIKELCPNGVEWKTLGEIGKISMCKRIMKNETSDSGDIPFYKIGSFGGIADSFISRDLFEKYKKTYSYPKKGEILLSASGTIGKSVIFDGSPSYFQDSNIVWISNDEKVVFNKYLYYYYQIAKWNISSGGTIARLYNDNLAKTPIQIPPLPVQTEIVRILDKFVEQQEQLEKLIELRMKQYEYYREEMLTAKEGWETKTLGEICDIKGRIGFRGYTREDQVKKGEGAISLSPGNIENSKLFFDDCAYISWDKYEESPEIMVNLNDVIFCKTGSTVGKVAIVTELVEKTTINPQLVVLKNVQCSNKYLYYYLTRGEIQYDVKKFAGIGSVPNISQEKLSGLTIKLPNEDIQNEIVKILDSFESSISALTSALELSKKRYEHYRDEMLRF